VKRFADAGAAMCCAAPAHNEKREGHGSPAGGRPPEPNISFYQCHGAFIHCDAANANGTEGRESLGIRCIRRKRSTLNDSGDSQPTVILPTSQTTRSTPTPKPVARAVASTCSIFCLVSEPPTQPPHRNADDKASNAALTTTLALNAGLSNDLTSAWDRPQLPAASNIVGGAQGRSQGCDRRAHARLAALDRAAQDEPADNLKGPPLLQCLEETSSVRPSEWLAITSGLGSAL
jgi:hypothetical protein